MISKTSNITISISSPQNSWHEVDEATIVFGEKILIIHNSSYRAGFGDRVEETKLVTIKKDRDLNPCVLCDDVYNELVNMKADEAEDVIQAAETAINNKLKDLLAGGI